MWDYDTCKPRYKNIMHAYYKHSTGKGVFFNTMSDIQLSVDWYVRSAINILKQ